MDRPGLDAADRTTWGRRVVALASSLLLGPALLLYAYELTWFSPEITDGAACEHESTWWSAHDATVFWLAASVAAVGGALCFGYALHRVRHEGRWWPWPAGAITFLVAGWPALMGLASAAWCPVR